MKRIKDLTNKERWLVSYLLWDATQKVERIMLYDDENERSDYAMIALSDSPDEIDNLLCDIYYGVNTLSIKLRELEEKRGETTMESKKWYSLRSLWDNDKDMFEIQIGERGAGKKFYEKKER